MIYLVVVIEHWLVTDSQTHGHGMCHASIASHWKIGLIDKHTYIHMLWFGVYVLFGCV